MCLFLSQEPLPEFLAAIEGMLSSPGPDARAYTQGQEHAFLLIDAVRVAKRVVDSDELALICARAATGSNRTRPVTTSASAAVNAGTSPGGTSSPPSAGTTSSGPPHRVATTMRPEATASAGIIGSLPPAVMILVSLTTPAYMARLFTDPRGQFMLLIAVAMMAFGVFVMKKMISFKF